MVDGNEDGYPDWNTHDSNENGVDDATETYSSTGTIGGSHYGDMTIVPGDTSAAAAGASWGTISGSTNTGTGNADVDALVRDHFSAIVGTGIQRNSDIDGDSYRNSDDRRSEDRTRY